MDVLKGMIWVASTEENPVQHEDWGGIPSGVSGVYYT